MALFENTSNSSKIAVVIVIMILVGGGWYYFYYMDMAQKIDSLKREIDTLSRYKRELPVLRVKYKQAQKEFNVYKKELPLKEEIPSLLVKLTNIIKSQDVSLVAFTPGKAIPKDLYFVKPISVRLTANYTSCGAVFEDIAHMKRLFKVVNFSLSDPKIINTHKVLLDVKFEAETYYFKNKKEPGKRRK